MTTEHANSTAVSFDDRDWLHIVIVAKVGVHELEGGDETHASALVDQLEAEVNIDPVDALHVAETLDTDVGVVEE